MLQVDSITYKQKAFYRLYAADKVEFDEFRVTETLTGHPEELHFFINKKPKCE